MTADFFERPILNSPYDCPSRHWELDDDGQPTNRIIEMRRRCDFITPVPKPKKRRRSKDQAEVDLRCLERTTTFAFRPPRGVWIQWASTS